MIGERIVLRRIEHFQQRARRVALIRRAQFIDFVEQKNGVFRTRLLHPLNDATGQRAHVRPTVAANVRFVACATKRNAYILAAERARDRFRDRRLAHARRTVEQQDWTTRHHTRLCFGCALDGFVACRVGRRDRIRIIALELGNRELSRRRDLGGHLLRSQLTHREKLKHAILHVLETVVIFFENLRCTHQFEVIVRTLVPRQLGDPFEVRANHLRFHRLTTGALESPKLTLRFGTRFFRELELGQLVAKFGDLLALIVVAQLFLDRLHLFAQEHLALPFAQLFLNLRLDVFLRFKQPDLTLHVHKHAAQPFFNRQRLEKSLLFRDSQFDVASDEIAEPAGIVDRIENLMHDFFGKSALFSKFGCTLAGFLVQRFECSIFQVERHHLFGRYDHGRQISVDLLILKCGSTLLALQEQLHAAQPALNLPDAGNHAGGKEDVGRWLFGVVALSNGKHESITLEGGLDRPECAGTTRRDRGGNSGEHDGPAQRQDGKCLALAHTNDPWSRIEDERRYSGTISTVGFPPSRQGLQLFPDRMT